MRLLPLALALALAACPGGPSSDDAPADNRAPGAPEVALSPLAPTTLDPIRLQVLAEPSDPDGDDVTFAVRWTVDNVPRPDLADALEVPADLTAKGQTWQARVVAVDVHGAESAPAVASVAVGNAPPSVTLATSPEAPTAHDDLTLVVTSDDPDGDAVGVTVTWRLDGNPTPQWDDHHTLPADALARGQRWTARAVPSDGEAEGEPAVLEVEVGDAPPIIGTVSLTPAAPREGDVLQVTATAVDPEGDPITFAYAWLVDGTRVAAPSAPTLDGAWFDKGQSVRAEVTPISAGTTRGVAVLSEPVTIENTPPTLVAATVTPPEGHRGTTFSCAPEGLADVDPGDAPTARTEWFVDGAPAGSTPTLTGSAFERGDAITCRLTPTDGDDDGPARTSSSVVAGNAPPTVASVSLGPSNASRASTLTATPGATADLDGDTVTLRYAWWADGVKVTGATSSLSATALARGTVVEVQAIPSDGSDEGPPVRSAPLTLGNAAPTLTLSWSPEHPNPWEDLTVIADATDLDGDTLTTTWAWTVNGAPAGSNAATLPKSAFVRDDWIEVTVTVTDGHGGRTTARHDGGIGNAPPGAPTVRLAPSDPDGADDLVCTLTQAATDPDGDELHHGFHWTVDGEFYAGASTEGSTSTVSHEATFPGEVWACAGVASDVFFSTFGPPASVTIAEVPCGANAADDGDATCACEVGFDWCDEGRTDCCALPVTSFDLTIVSGAIDETRPDGRYWDDLTVPVPPFIWPDGYVELWVSGTYQGRTSTASDTTAPVWNHAFSRVTIDALDSVELVLVDDDTLFDEEMDAFELTYQDLLDHLDGGPFTLWGTVADLVIRVDTP